MTLLHGTAHRGRTMWVIVLIIAVACGAFSLDAMAQTPTPTTGGAASTPAVPAITAATLQPTIAGGSANLPVGSQSTSGTPRITALLVIAVVALIALGAGFTARRRRFRRLP